MMRKFLIALLAFGTIGGYAAGVRSLCHARERRAAFERHVAQVCVEAAREGDTQKRASGKVW
jgi:hypothetical protein